MQFSAILCFTTYVMTGFGQMGHISYKYLRGLFFYYQTKLCLIHCGGQRKNVFTQEILYLQVILSDINEPETFFLL